MRLVARRAAVAGVGLLGSALLGRSLATRPGSAEFYTSTGAVALTWTVGGLVLGRGRQGSHRSLRHPLATPVLAGVGAFGAFYTAALVALRIPVLDDALVRVLRFADEGDDRGVLATTLANGLAEEVFFRGALYAAYADSRPVAVSTAGYALSTTTTRNPALVLAAGVMGTLFGVERRVSGGIVAPAITHVTWSALMIRFLPPLVRGRHARVAARARLESGSSPGS